jgi:thioredoxin-related protein/predicted aspartyl protease
MKMMTRMVLLIVFVLGVVSSAWAIEWEKDIQVAMLKAKDSNKPVMVDFSTEWCTWCKKLDKEVYTAPDVNKLADNFISVKVDCGKDKTACTKYGLRGYPTIIFFNSEGVRNETVVGYRDAETFAGIMSKVLDMTQKPVVAEEKPAAVAVAVSKKERAPGEFELQGIMQDKAIINGKIVVRGQTLDGAKVLDIRENHVKLDYNGKDITIGLCCPVVEADADTVYFKNGRHFSGIITKVTDVAVELDTDSGTVLISRKSIRIMKRASPEALARLREIWAKSCVELQKQSKVWDEERQKRRQEYVDWLRHTAERRALEDGVGKEVEILRDPQSRAIVTETLLDGEVKASLIVDTGSDAVVLTKLIGIALGIDMSINSGSDIRDIRVVGGKTVKAKMVVLKSIKIQDVEEKDVYAAILLDDVENPGFRDGLLGRSFLNRFNIMIDSNGMRMGLERVK